jgi:hypothetical protein
MKHPIIAILFGCLGLFSVQNGVAASVAISNQYYLQPPCLAIDTYDIFADADNRQPLPIPADSGQFIQLGSATELLASRCSESIADNEQLAAIQLELTVFAEENASGNVYVWNPNHFPVALRNQLHDTNDPTWEDLLPYKLITKAPLGYDTNKRAYDVNMTLGAVTSDGNALGLYVYNQGEQPVHVRGLVYGYATTTVNQAQEPVVTEPIDPVSPTPIFPTDPVYPTPTIDETFCEGAGRIINDIANYGQKEDGTMIDLCTAMTPGTGTVYVPDRATVYNTPSIYASNWPANRAIIYDGGNPQIYYPGCAGLGDIGMTQVNVCKYDGSMLSNVTYVQRLPVASNGGSSITFQGGSTGNQHARFQFSVSEFLNADAPGENCTRQVTSAYGYFGSECTATPGKTHYARFKAVVLPAERTCEEHICRMEVRAW